MAPVSGKASLTVNSGDLDVDSHVHSHHPRMPARARPGRRGSLPSVNPGVSARHLSGGSYDGANFTNGSTVFIGDVDKAVSGNVNVNVTTQTLSVAVGQAGDKATQFGITGTFNNLNLTQSADAYIQTKATVSASQNVGVAAGDTLTDFSVGGALGVGGQGQVGVAVNWNQISDTTLAYIGDPANPRSAICTGCGVTAGLNVNVGAASAENIYAITYAAAKSGNSGKGADGETPSTSPTPTGQTAPSTSTPGGPASAQNGAGGGTYGFGISGEIAMNQIGSSSSSPGIVTNAFINNAANVTASNGNVALNAQDTSFDVAAGLAGTVGQQAALAGAYGQNSINRQVQAFTGNATVAGVGFDERDQQWQSHCGDSGRRSQHQ